MKRRGRPRDWESAPPFNSIAWIAALPDHAHLLVSEGGKQAGQPLIEPIKYGVGMLEEVLIDEF